MSLAAITSAINRRLPWWAGPIAIVTALTLFTFYSLWVVFFQSHAATYQTPEGINYLSPFYSPYIPSPWEWLSPAVFILWIPLGFRATCYYYRKAYYRAFFWDPPACSDDAQRKEPREPESYRGERAAPWIFNNIHRYFFYGSIIIVTFLAIEAVLAMFPVDGGFALPLGALILLINAILLGGYTFGCHSFRHLIGGRLDCYSCFKGGGALRKLYKGVSKLNARHATWAWASLFSVVFADIYLRLVIAGFISDPILFRI